MKRTTNMNIDSLPMIHVMNHEAPRTTADQSKDIGWKAAAAAGVAIASVAATWAAKKVFRNKPEESHVYHHEASDGVAATAANAIENAENGK